MIVTGRVGICRDGGCPGEGTWAVLFPFAIGGTRREPEHFVKWGQAMNEYREEDRKVRENATQS
jgi:hypothetical protein